MAMTDLEVANLGLGKLSASRISVLSASGTPLERHITAGFAHWRKSELLKHRWVFATIDNFEMTLSDTLDEAEDGRIYVYDLDTDVLRPIRTQDAEWKQRGRKLYSKYDTLTISYLQTTTVIEDDLFIEVLACRVARECVEYITQSNTKKADIIREYDEWIDQAKRNNAFIVGSEDINMHDEDYPFIAARMG